MFVLSCANRSGNGWQKSPVSAVIPVHPSMPTMTVPAGHMPFDTLYHLYSVPHPSHRQLPAVEAGVFVFGGSGMFDAETPITVGV
jgi:hypothetical protein